ncbi:MAG: pimeloyl-ACP methyl ester carboxylesterase [Myxococcota bacterium]|jgi:pimeloyl-ACP methyl ester carboxylesterase
MDINTIDSGEQEGTPVIFLHGLSAWMDFWRLQLAPVAETRRVLALDLPGYGGSDAPDAPYTPSWFADIIVAWLDTIGVQQLDLVAHSMGGQVALNIAARFPERVRRMVLSAPAGFEQFHPSAASVMKAYWTLDRAQQSKEPAIRTHFETAVFARTDSHVDLLVEQRVRMGLHPSFYQTSRAVARSVAGMLDEPVFDQLSQVQAPTLVVFGGRDGLIPNRLFTRMTTRQLADDGVAQLPNGRLCWLDTAGHTAHHDDPTGFNRAMMRFLETP